MKVSFIATIFNEEATIKDLLQSLFSQSKFPDEIMIVDGGSTDNTISEISKFKFPVSHPKAKIKLIIKEGNRSVGRNEAIKNASNEIIACSDAGCTLDKDWVKNIIEPFQDPKVDVVAGYYNGVAKNVFQKCLIPYVLVMPEKVDSVNFLPASRSMAFKKSVWGKVGGFDEKYSHNEDYVFARKLRDYRVNIYFEKNAVVKWLPRNNFKDAFKMFLRFSLGDSESGIIRDKIILIFARYFLGIYFLLLAYIEKSLIPLYVVASGVLIYILWSIKKNYKYVNHPKALLFLPLLQLTSDFAVLVGTGLGFFKRINIKDIYKIVRNNKGLAIIIGSYVICMLLLINWGIPNKSHPFNYFMDEWHQMSSVRAVFTKGSSNIPGSANGSMFHFLISGLLLVPFIVTGIINPFAIKSSLDNLEIQQRLFELLRLNTLFFGVISIVLIAYIAKKYFKLDSFIVSFLFVVNPIWISLSNYFKYDIALIFWIILSLLLMLRYSVSKLPKDFFIATFVSAIAFSVKVSALPLLPILLLSYAIYTKRKDYSIRHLILGLLLYFFTFLIFGIPDLLLGKGNIGGYLYDNLVRSPNLSSNYILGTNYVLYLFFKGASTTFGYFLFILSNVAVLFMTIYLLKNKVKDQMNKRYLIVLISLLAFVFSLLFLKIEARGNRLLVLLPFIVLISGIFINKVIKLSKGYLRTIIVFILIIFSLFQLVESFSWINLKLNSDSRQSSSNWIISHIPSGSLIGIENIPIYQSLPDVLLKDFYTRDRHVNQKLLYSYKLIDDSYAQLPSFVVVTNEESHNYYKSTEQNLIMELVNRNYKIIYNIKLNLSLLNLFRNKLDYFMSSLIQEPLSISIYKKQ